MELQFVDCRGETQDLGEAVRTMRFGPVDVKYDRRVLEPRPWTIAQSTWAAELLRGLPDGPVLELCAGVGQIGLAATSGSGRDLVLVDLDETACGFARENAAAAGGRVEVRCGPMDRVLRPDERFRLVVADPPYIPTGHVGRFPADPMTAIDGGRDGLALVRACLTVLSVHLADDGEAVLQLRDGAQVRAVDAHLAANRHLRLRLAGSRHPEGGALARLIRG